MPSINLGVQSFTNDHSLMPDIEMDNLYFEVIPKSTTGDISSMYRKKRPGIETYYVESNRNGSILAMIRTIGIFDSAIFTVEQGKNTNLLLYKNDNGVKTRIGNVSSYITNLTEPNVKMIYTQFGLVILNDQHELYVYKLDGTLSTITVPENYVPQDITSLNNYLMIGCTSGRVYYLEPNEWVFTDDNANSDSSVSGNTDSVLNYFTAESLPDGLVAIQNIRSQLYIFGQLTTEIWQTTGDSNSPFTKAIGLDLLKGTLTRNTILPFDNTVVWIGQDNIIYRAETIPERISTNNIESKIQNSSYHYLWYYYLDGHLFLVVQLDDDTLVYDASTKFWSTLSSPNQTKFNFVGYQDLTDTYLFTSTVSSTSRTIYKFNKNIFEDYGTMFTCTVTGVLSTDLPLQIKNLCLLTSQSDSTTYLISWRNSYDTNYSNPRSIVMNRSDMTRKMIFMVGQCVAPYKEFKITCTSDTDINIIGLNYNAPNQFMNR